jgi:hypothetical protein
LLSVALFPKGEQFCPLTTFRFKGVIVGWFLVFLNLIGIIAGAVTGFEYHHWWAALFIWACVFVLDLACAGINGSDIFDAF